jgi:hypothetical protein
MFSFPVTKKDIENGEIQKLINCLETIKVKKKKKKIKLKSIKNNSKFLSCLYLNLRSHVTF